MISIEELLKKDPYRLNILKLVASLELPDCYIAAGFVRNMVWDYLHDYPPSKLNDVDVIFFDKKLLDERACRGVENNLSENIRGVKWQVKNQALMHLKNNHPPYQNSYDAMTYWPEKETAVAVRLNQQGSIQVLAPFSTDSLFRGEITHNPICDIKIFISRVKSKVWLEKWPKLKLVC